MKIIFSAFIIIFFLMPYQLLAENYCGDINLGGHRYGPYDYSNPDHRRKYLPVVEGAHFRKETQQIIADDVYTLRGIGADLAYTLRSFPNHFLALSAMSKLSLRVNRAKPRGSSHSVLCFFERATRFKPDDAMVRSIFGGHLLKIGEFDLAFEHLTAAAELDPNNPTFNYNLGLLYFDKKNYVQAKKYANKAYSQGFPLPGLMNKLKSIGKW